MTNKQPKENYQSLSTINNSGFDIDKQTLADLFKTDCINSGVSATSFKNLGSIKGIASKLKTDTESGLNSIDHLDIHNRERSFGKNINFQKMRICEIINYCFEDRLLRMVLIVTILDIIFSNNKTEGIAVMITVLLTTFINVIQEYKKYKKFEKIHKDDQFFLVKVIRDSSTIFIKDTELLVGDLLVFKIGDFVPVDGLLVEGIDVIVEEINIGGVKKLINKKPSNNEEFGDPFMLSGCLINSGSGVMLVCVVGDLKQRISEEASTYSITVLQEKIEKFTENLAYKGVIFSILIILALLIHIGIDVYQEKKCALCLDFIIYLIKDFRIGLVVMIFAISQSMPISISLSLSYIMTKMREFNIRVPLMSSIETLGYVDSICTDLTGTLTTDIMRVESLYFEENSLDLTEFYKSSFPNTKSLEFLCESICINSSVTRKILPDGKFELTGDKSALALLEFSEKLGYPYHINENIIHILPDDNKLIVLCRISKNLYRVHVQGPTERILPLSSFLYDKHGDKTPLTQIMKDEITSNILDICVIESLSIIALAYKDIEIIDPEDPILKDKDFLSKDLNLIAIFGIGDYLREGVNISIEKLKKAGIDVRVMTGDSTAKAVYLCKKLGLLPEKYFLDDKSCVVMEGDRFIKEIGDMIEKIDQDTPKKRYKEVIDIKKFNEVIKELKVLSSATYEAQYDMVTGLKQDDHVVAVIGGNDDMMTHKRSDVSIIMNSGCKIAKDAAGIILMDNNVNSVVLAIQWGRKLIESIRRLAQYQATSNIVGLMLCLIGIVVNGVSPITVIELLWINFIMNTMVVIVIIMEEPTDRILTMKPLDKNEGLITSSMKQFIFCHSLYQLAILLVILFAGPKLLHIPDSKDMQEYDPIQAQHYTIVFHAFVMMLIFNMINCRMVNKKDFNVFKNFMNKKVFFMIMIIIYIVQMIFVEFGGFYLMKAPLTIKQHLICIGFGVFEIFFGIVFKAIPQSFFNTMKCFRENIKVNDKANETYFIKEGDISMTMI